MNNEHLKCGLRPPAQAPPHRGFCPGGRARWLGKIAECGTPSPTLPPGGGGRGWGGLRTPRLRRNASCRQANFKGMTLIEVIVVMIIIGIVAAIVIPRFDFATSSQASVDGAANMIASDIRYAQEFAMANRVSKSISFSTVPPANKYTFSPVSTGMDPSGQLSGATIGTTIQFTFNSLGEPTTSSPGVWAVTVSAGGVTRTITVLQYTGKVNIS